MALLIIQLSDLHARSGTEQIFAIKQTLYNAVAAELDAHTEFCLIIFNGDAAYGAQEIEFGMTAEFLLGLRLHLAEKAPALRIQIVSVPGNHDCDLTSEDSEARTLLRVNVSSKLPSPSISNVLLKAQNAYFAFAAKIAGPDFTLSSVNPYHKTFDITLNDGLVRVNLLNSAWTSIIHEEDDLRYPLEAFKPATTPDAQYSIAILHHPTHWFLMPGVRRELRTLLESNSDIVLTGHEHENEKVRLSNPDGGEINYIEGGVLHDHSRPDLITFNMVRIDFENDSQRIIRNELDGTYFKTVGALDDSSLQINRFRLDRELRLSPQFDGWLDEFEDPLSHPRQEDLRLSHLFAYPDLRKINNIDMGTTRSGNSQLIDIVKSDKVLEEIEINEAVLIAGGDKAGKTTILKRLMWDRHHAGKVPVFIKGGEIARSGNVGSLRKQIGKAIEKQYQFLKSQAFEQLDRQQRVLFIDDFHDMSADPSARARILSYATQHFASVIIAANNDLYAELVGSRDRADVNLLLRFQKYEIADFGRRRFEDLTIRWTTLGRHNVDKTEIKASALEICDRVNAIVAIAGLPHTPWLLLVLLERGDFPDASVAAKNGDIGHLYSAVITVKLARSKLPRFDLTGKFTYLSQLAYELYGKNSATLSAVEFQLFHKEYMERFDFSIGQEAVLNDLVETRMLRDDGGEVAFRHKFVFAFFVASWISRNIHKPEAIALIQRLCERLDYDISANVLLFLAHMNENPVIFEEMKKAAASMLKTSTIAKMTTEVAGLNKLSTVRVKYALPSTPPEVNRRMLLEAQDEQNALIHSPSEHDGRLLKPLPGDDEVKEVIHKELRELRAALRTIRILGQVLRNKAQGAESEDKIGLMQALLDLDRRVMGYLFGFLKDLDQMILHLRKRLMAGMVASRIRQAREKEDATGANASTTNKLGRAELRQMWKDAAVYSKRFWIDIYSMASFGAVKQAAMSIGLQELDVTFAKIRSKEKTEGRGEDSVPLHLIDLCVKMNRHIPTIPYEDFARFMGELQKTGNTVGQRVLENIGWERVVYFDTLHAQRQAICKAMDLKVPPVAFDQGKKKFTS